MTVRLWRYEWGKLWFTYKGIWLLLGFVLLKTALLCVLPEMTDARLGMSKTQYNEVMYGEALGFVVHGEAAAEKERQIAETYAFYQSMRMEDARFAEQMRRGEITNDDYWAFYQENEPVLSQINRYHTVLEIVNEKRLQFAAQQRDEGLAPPAYFYEYGWASALTYMGWLDPLAFLIAMTLAIQMVCPEIASGAMRVTHATRYGRAPLFFAKLTVLTVILCVTAALSAAMELGLFTARFDLSEGAWPLYSITPYADTRLPLSLSLSQAFVTLSVIRAAGLVLTGLFTFALACLASGAAQTAFMGLALVVLPWLTLPEFAFTPGAWLAGRSVFLTEQRPLSALVMGVIVLDLLGAAFWVRFGRAR